MDRASDGAAVRVHTRVGANISATAAPAALHLRCPPLRVATRRANCGFPKD